MARNVEELQIKLRRLGNAAFIREGSIDEGSTAETSEFYVQLSAFNLPPSHF